MTLYMSPEARHGICVQARHEPCTVCGAGCEQPCHGTPAHPACPTGAVHLCRACLAAKDGRITRGDLASVMDDSVMDDSDGAPAGWSLVPDAVAS